MQNSLFTIFFQVVTKKYIGMLKDSIAENQHFIDEKK